MILFQSLGVSIVGMLLGMFFLGTWPNFFKYREKDVHKEHIFIIYVIAAFITSIIYALTLGSAGSEEPDFIPNLYSASAARVLSAFSGGVIIALANLLMVFAIEISGVAIALPTSRGISVIGGTLLNHALSPVEKFELLIAGIVLIIIALIFESVAYLEKEKFIAFDKSNSIALSKMDDLAKQNDIGETAPDLTRSPRLRKGKSAEVTVTTNEGGNSDLDRFEKTTDGSVKLTKFSKRGIIISVVSGIVGCFWPPMSTYSMQSRGLHGSLNAYACFFFFMIGFLIAGIALNIFFMYRPLGRKQPTTIGLLFRLEWRFYLVGVIAGVLCATGHLLDFVAGQSSGGYAVAYAISQANALVSGVFGIILWKEFEGTNHLTKLLYIIGLLFYVAAIVTLAFSL